MPSQIRQGRQPRRLMMAYMTQSNKKRIAEKLKTVMPTGWKYSLAVRDHSKLVLTIQAAPVDILRAMAASSGFTPAHVALHVARATL